jgi:8-amino-7-oxononanoate synthase
MRDFIVNRSRSFIYATAPPPLMAAVVRAALAISETADERRQRLASIVTIAGERLAAHGFAASGSQIQPIIVGEDTRAVELARRLQIKGFDIRAIRPPTVPPGTARLRMALTLNTDEATVTRLIDTLADELAAMKWNTP